MPRSRRNLNASGMPVSGPGAGHPFIETVQRYYHGCNTADVDLMMSCFAPDVVHYFTHYKPVAGARALAEFWAHIVPKHGNHFEVDHGLAQGDEAVVEWSLELTMDPAQGRELIRGAEWYVFEDGLIKEIRAYYLNRHEPYDRADFELWGFPYAERGYHLKP